MIFTNLNELFQQIVLGNSNGIALFTPSYSITYKELNILSDRYAKKMLNNGFSRGDVLAVFNTKEKESYAILLACLKIGVTYVNIDSESPISRNLNILNRCNPKAIFIDHQNEQLDSEFGKLFEIIEFSIELNQEVSIKNENHDGNTIAYIMFTSGSTGDPKGVAITHQNLLGFISWIKKRYQITECDRFANLSPMYFDNSVFDFYGAIFNGATLCPVKKEITDQPMALVNYVDEIKATIWFSVPSLLVYLINMRAVRSGVLTSVRVFTFGGEGFPKSILYKLFSIYKGSAKFVNVYGPTEGTCICSSYDITEKDFKDLKELPSLGTINQNFSYEILKEKNQKKGELIIIGPSISPGYYNDSERSEKVFGTYKKGEYYLNRFYRTGDLVEEKKGLLYFIGRVDNQIKHMGYRIELEEIENGMNRVLGIQESAAIYKRVNDSYGKIYAYVVCKNLSQEEIKKNLKEYLPTYMIPNKIIMLNVLPKNQNGKIDRKALLIF